MFRIKIEIYQCLCWKTFRPATFFGSQTNLSMSDEHYGFPSQKNAHKHTQHFGFFAPGLQTSWSPCNGPPKISQIKNRCSRRKVVPLWKPSFHFVSVNLAFGSEFSILGWSALIFKYPWFLILVLVLVLDSWVHMVDEKTEGLSRVPCDHSMALWPLPPTCSTLFWPLCSSIHPVCLFLPCTYKAFLDVGSGKNMPNEGMWAFWRQKSDFWIRLGSVFWLYICEALSTAACKNNNCVIQHYWNMIIYYNLFVLQHFCNLIIYYNIFFDLLGKILDEEKCMLFRAIFLYVEMTVGVLKYLTTLLF